MTNSFLCSVARKLKKKEKHKNRKAYDSKLTAEGIGFFKCFIILMNFTYLHNFINQFVYICLTEIMDSSTYKRFMARLDNILENLEDVDLTAAGKLQTLLSFQSS